MNTTLAISTGTGVAAEASAAPALLARDMVARCGTNFPARIAYRCGADSRTWAAFHARSDRMAAAMQQAGIHNGDAVGALLPECIAVYEHMAACFKIGAVRVGLNRRLSMRELAHVVRDSDIRLLVAHADCGDLLRELQDSGVLEGVVVVGIGSGHGLALDLETLMEQAPEHPELPPLGPDDAALYCYTSGTTGLPKAAIVTQGAVQATIVHASLHFGFAPDDTFYMPTGNSWVAVLLGILGLSSGFATAIPDRQFDIGALFSDLERHAVTVLLVAPTMLQWAVEARRTDTHDLSRLRLIAFGSAATPPALIRAADKTFGCDLVNCYAATETSWGGISFMQPADMRRALSHEPHLLESVGQVSTLFEISIRSEDGRPLPPGEAGEIWLKSPANMAGYLHRPDQTAEAILDGWLRTNDIGRLDAEGFLYLLDRRNFVIISGGINVYPVVVEAALAEHPAILEACVVGIPHPVWGEAIVAAVVCREGAEIDPDALRSHSRERLNRVQVPKHFHILDEPLPRTSTGKVRKLEVRDRLAAMPHLFAWNRPGS